MAKKTPPSEDRPFPIRPGKKVQSIRWTLPAAHLEFGADKSILAKRLRTLGIDPGPDGCYSTLQICSARFGSLELERTRKAREDADSAERENAIAQQILCRKEHVIAFLSEAAINVRQQILAARITKQEQDAVLLDLQRLFEDRVVLKNLFPEEK